MKNLFLTMTVVLISNFVYASVSQLEFGIYSDYKHGLGKVNFYPCSAKRMIVEFDSNTCSSPLNCTKRGTEKRYLIAKYSSGEIILISNNNTYLSLTSEGNNNYRVLYANKSGSHDLHARAKAKVTPYSESSNCDQLQRWKSLSRE